jgi:uncharacterized protein YggU (UPF0235/DUF167 family)
MSVLRKPFWFLTLAYCLFSIGINQVFASSSATRSIEGSYTVSIKIEPAAGTASYAVEEEVAQGWEVSGITEGGFHDTKNNKVKWGPWFDDVARTLEYKLVAPADFSGEITLNGVASFDGQNIGIKGQDKIGTEPQPEVLANRVITQSGDDWVVRIEIKPAAGTASYAVEEEVAQGWEVSGITEGGFHDARNHKLKWGPWFDDVARTLEYKLVAPAGFSGAMTLNGVASFDGQNIGIKGQDKIETIGDGPKPEVLAKRAITQSGDDWVVRIEIKPAAGTGSYAVEEEVAQGWEVSEITEGGFHDTKNNKVKWGPWFDDVARTLEYKLVAPAGFSGAITLNGVASFDGQNIGIKGQDSNSPKLVYQSKNQLTLIGRPGRFFTIQFTNRLNEPWQDLKEVHLDESQTTLQLAPESTGNRFYRALQMD